MAGFVVQVRVKRELVIRESDGETLWLMAGYLGNASDDAAPSFVQVIAAADLEPPPDDE